MMDRYNYVPTWLLFTKNCKSQFHKVGSYKWQQNLCVHPTFSLLIIPITGIHFMHMYDVH